MIDVGVRIGTVVGIALLACAGAPVLAALPDPLADGLRRCAGESDQGKRLACFDALAAGLPKVEADQFGLTAEIARKRQLQGKSQTAGTANASTAGGTVAGGTRAGAGTVAGGTGAGRSAARGTAAGGMETASIGAGSKATTRKPGTATSGAEAKAAGQFLPGKITALRQASGGVLVFTLDNNQVWVQADADTRFTFNVGDDVRIEHGAMGSFWLAANKGRKTKVKRIG